MATTITWDGIEYNSAENCTIHVLPGSIEVNSVITGNYKGDVYQVDYKIRLDITWQVKECLINSKVNNTARSWLLHKDTGGGWQLSNELLPGTENCFDIDITVTPFTNSLPINRLQLQKNEPCEISVIYFDILVNDVRIVKQRYERLSAKSIHFQNVPNDFEANIEIDENGLVVNYPGLFRRLPRQ